MSYSNIDMGLFNTVQGAVQGATPYGSVVQGAVQGAQQIPGLQEAVTGATNAAGQIDYPRLQRIMGLTNEQMQSYISNGALSGAGGTPISSYTSPVTNTGTSASGTDTSGGILGLNSPYQSATNSRNDAIMNAPVNGYTGSSGGSSGGGLLGGGGAGGTAQNGSAGLSTALTPNGSTANNSPSGIVSGISYPNTAPTNYTQPGGAPAPQQGNNGALQMQQQSPQNAMNQYLATPGNQLLGDPSYQRFQHSPGYQYAVNEALGQVQSNASARGLLESGRVMRDMTDRAQGMAQQDYGNWWNRQNQLYGDYQNRLAGLAGGDTGAAMANQLGQNLGAGSMQMGSNLGSLFGNQANTGMGGIINTGAAQANSMQMAGNTQAQINAANQSTQLAGATSGLF